MMLRGESANLLSVGAIDFGLVVDATVIMMENIFRHLSGEVSARGEREKRRAEAEADGLHGKLATILVAAQEVEQPIFFSAAIIVAGFIPLFTMTGVEGHIFGPMARTYAYAIAGGLIATFTVTPALAAFLLPAKLQETETAPGALPASPLCAGCRNSRWPTGFWRWAVRRALLGFALLAVTMLGMEFLPHLEEGNLWIRATMPASISLETANGYVNQHAPAHQILSGGETVVSQHGRPDDGTDATGFFNAEFFVPLKPSSQWPGGVDKDKLTEDLNAALTAQISRRGFQFLPEYRGQCRGSGLRRERREFRQAVRQRSADAGRHRRARSRR